ncbi:hypothetical protein GCM10010178_13040 [Lentzea flava]|uniref:SD-repeat containing protein B domain-containing protein n=1 Tax=Lentzea flava TaxID=103732 RepID=A0ABQ2UCM3_9PSEU|nr:hypothetical protein GCM10010178_13040 [Lentzea flava]
MDLDLDRGVSGPVQRLGGRGAGFYAQAEIVQTYGDLNGVVYVDRNHNEQQDPGEEAADTVVEANGGVPYGYVKTTTDANGRFTFKNIPGGSTTSWPTGGSSTRRLRSSSFAWNREGRQRSPRVRSTRTPKLSRPRWCSTRRSTRSARKPRSPSA